MPKQPGKKSKRERQLEERLRLEKTAQRLRHELSTKERHIVDADRQVQQVRSDAVLEVRRLSGELQDTAQNVEEIRAQAIHELFVDLLASPAQISLIKLLALPDDTDVRWLLPLTYYLRDRVGLRFVGEKDQYITLTQDNCDDYALREQVTLPCEAVIIKRGFAIGETIIQRPEVTVLEGSA